MRHINLDPEFSPLGTGIDFEAFTFYGGEPHIKIQESLTLEGELMITHRVRSFNDLGLILLAVDALQRMGLNRISLLIPYFPGARQDRLMVPGEPLTVKVYADLINTLNLERVVILDPHSEVTPALVNNVEVISNHQFVKKAIAGLDDFLLVAPDASAVKKVHSLAGFIKADRVVECGKSRDVSTGKLNGFRVFEEDLQGSTCVVVDDICDGGGTFLGLAQALKNKNAGRMIMIVTHGIFSHGTQELKELYDEIICTDSFQTLTDPAIQQIELSTHLLK